MIPCTTVTRSTHNTHSSPSSSASSLMSEPPSDLFEGMVTSPDSSSSLPMSEEGEDGAADYSMNSEPSLDEGSRSTIRKEMLGTPRTGGGGGGGGMTISPARVAKLANAFGVNTPVPSSAEAQFGFASGSISRSSATRFLLHVIPPDHLASDPSSSAQLRRGTLVPLHSTLRGQLSAIAREYGIPSTVGMLLYLLNAQSESPTESLGPRISEEAWKLLWQPLLRMERDEVAQAINSPRPSAFSFRHSPVPSPPPTMHESPISESSERRGQLALRPLNTARSAIVSPPQTKRLLRNEDRSPSRQDSDVSFQSSAFQPSLAQSIPVPPIVGKVEFDVDRRRAPWYELWLERSRTRYDDSLSPVPPPTAPIPLRLSPRATPTIPPKSAEPYFAQFQEVGKDEEAYFPDEDASPAFEPPLESTASETLPAHSSVSRELSLRGTPPDGSPTPLRDYLPLSDEIESEPLEDLDVDDAGEPPSAVQEEPEWAHDRQAEAPHSPQYAPLEDEPEFEALTRSVANDVRPTSVRSLSEGMPESAVEEPRLHGYVPVPLEDEMESEALPETVEDEVLASSSDAPGLQEDVPESTREVLHSHEYAPLDGGIESDTVPGNEADDVHALSVAEENVEGDISEKPVEAAQVHDDAPRDDLLQESAPESPAETPYLHEYAPLDDEYESEAVPEGDADEVPISSSVGPRLQDNTPESPEPYFQEYAPLEDERESQAPLDTPVEDLPPSSLHSAGLQPSAEESSPETPHVHDGLPSEQAFESEPSPAKDQDNARVSFPAFPASEESTPESPTEQAHLRDYLPVEDDFESEPLQESSPEDVEPSPSAVSNLLEATPDHLDESTLPMTPAAMGTSPPTHGIRLTVIESSPSDYDDTDVEERSRPNSEDAFDDPQLSSFDSDPLSDMFANDEETWADLRDEVVLTPMPPVQGLGLRVNGVPYEPGDIIRPGPLEEEDAVEEDSPPDGDDVEDVLSLWNARHPAEEEVTRESLESSTAAMVAWARERGLEHPTEVAVPDEGVASHRNSATPHALSPQPILSRPDTVTPKVSPPAQSSPLPPVEHSPSTSESVREEQPLLTTSPEADPPATIHIVTASPPSPTQHPSPALSRRQIPAPLKLSPSPVIVDDRSDYSGEGASPSLLELYERDSPAHFGDDDSQSPRSSQLLMQKELDDIEKAYAQCSPRQLTSSFLDMSPAATLESSHSPEASVSSEAPSTGTVIGSMWPSVPVSPTVAEKGIASLLPPISIGSDTSSQSSISVETQKRALSAIEEDLIVPSDKVDGSPSSVPADEAQSPLSLDRQDSSHFSVESAHGSDEMPSQRFSRRRTNSIMSVRNFRKLWKKGATAATHGNDGTPPLPSLPSLPRINAPSRPANLSPRASTSSIDSDSRASKRDSGLDHFRFDQDSRLNLRSPTPQSPKIYHSPPTPTPPVDGSNASRSSRSKSVLRTWTSPVRVRQLKSDADSENEVRVHGRVISAPLYVEHYGLEGNGAPRFASLRAAPSPPNAPSQRPAGPSTSTPPPAPSAKVISPPPAPSAKADSPPEVPLKTDSPPRVPPKSDSPPRLGKQNSIRRKPVPPVPGPEPADDDKLLTTRAPSSTSISNPQSRMRQHPLSEEPDNSRPSMSSGTDDLLTPTELGNFEMVSPAGYAHIRSSPAF